MSLFIGLLAFNNQPAEYMASVRPGCVVGSILSGMIGAILINQH